MPWPRDEVGRVRPGPPHARCSDESFDKKIEYIRYNPVSAGLVREPEQWAYVYFHGW